MLTCTRDKCTCPMRPHPQQVGGAILADEMGLGKTAQAICFLGVLADWENDRWAAAPSWCGRAPGSGRA